MKYSLDEAIRLIGERERDLRIRMQHRRIRILLCCIGTLIVAAGATLYRLTGFDAVPNPLSSYGAFMLSEEAGGYILTGVVCFAVGVVFALIMIRMGRMRKKGPPDNSGNEIQDMMIQGRNEDK